ncbi:hypothetical protein CEXT_583551 [Caerostris extrusa]|uniref:Uncharacterized protein n=1 Tax=Caerostris extrusa TaxID=172846 RepID=A0AAV4NSG0_CAEEX|nr:hypothetical protein CEXT_583551 [Caerostris extrusa]
MAQVWNSESTLGQGVFCDLFSVYTPVDHFASAYDGGNIHPTAETKHEDMLPAHIATAALFGIGLRPLCIGQNMHHEQGKTKLDKAAKIF